MKDREKQLRDELKDDLLRRVRRQHPRIPADRIVLSWWGDRPVASPMGIGRSYTLTDQAVLG